MTSPDATPYINLLLRDLDPQDIFEIGINNLKTELPGWTPRDGNVEVVLLESMGIQIAELIYALNRVPSAVVQILLRLNNVEYDQGQQPTVDVQFNLADHTGTTIPAETSVQLDLPNDLDPIVFTTEAEVSVASGVTTVVIPTTGNRYTAEANGTAAGTTVAVLDSLIVVNSAVLATDVTAGRDAETDDEYFTRGIQMFNRMTDALILPRQFVSAMLEEVYVQRALAIDNYDPVGDPDNNGPTGADAGHITLAAYGDNENVSTDNKDALLAKITDLASAHLSVHIVDPTITDVDVTATIHIEEGFDPADVIENVEQALEEYLSPMTWDWSTSVRRNSLISIITNATGVDWLETLTTPAADAPLAGVAPLANAGTLNITEA